MSAKVLSLFAQPAEPTPSQVAAERRLNPLILKAHEAVLNCVSRCGPITADEVAERTGLTLNTVRARLTESTDGLYKRLPKMRRGAHLYILSSEWRPEMGAIPRRRHKGQT